MSGIVNINSKDDEGKPYIQGESSYLLQTFYFTDIFEPKLYKRFIKKVEGMVRGSSAYKNYIKGLLADFSTLRSDNINNKIDVNSAAIEMHHYPFTLYDVCDLVACKAIADKEPINTFLLTDKVLQLHYKGMIGLVPLSTTNHQLAHAGGLFISTKQIYGDYETFIDTYSDMMSDKMIDSIVMLNEQSKSGMKADFSGLLDRRGR